MITTAGKYLSAGLCVLPARREEKRPTFDWKRYQNRLPTEAEIGAWFANPHDAICILAGAVSGNAEMIDFDHGGELFDPWMAMIPDELKAKLVIETTQSDGWHVIYRSKVPVCGSVKLAQRQHFVTDAHEVFTEKDQEYVRLHGKPYQIRTDAEGRRYAIVTLIETRGEGGIFLCTPTAGYELMQGEITELPLLTEDERDQMLSAARELNEFFEPVQPEQLRSTDTGNRPGDDFNRTEDIRPLLEQHGWVRVRGGTNEYWRRPGKDKGWSATLKKIDGIDTFFVHTSSGYPFEERKSYKPFAIYALLEHNRNWKAAARALYKRGFGECDVPADVSIDDIVAQGQPDEPLRDPDEFSLSEMLRQYPTESEPIIDGWLRRGEVGNLIGGPKTYKTWLLQQTVISVLEGRKIFGYQATPGRVLLVDYELAKGTLSKRLYNVAHAMGTCVKAIDANLTLLAKRGKPFDLNALEHYLQTCGKKFDLIAIDPLFRLFPPDMDENSNADVAALYGRLINMAETSETALLVVHHMSKGSQADKAITDLGAGAGSQSRACDLHLTIREHEETDCAVVAGVVRSFKKFTPFCLRYTWPIWHAAPELDPDALARPGKKKKDAEPAPTQPEPEQYQWTPEDFVEAFITAEPSSKDVILLRANQAGVRDHLANKLLHAAEDDGLVYRGQHPRDRRRTLFANTPIPEPEEPEEEADEPEIDEAQECLLNQAELHVRLSASRRKAKLKVREAADELGVSKSALSYWEQGPDFGRLIPPEKIEHIETWLKSIGGYGPWNTEE